MICVMDVCMSYVIYIWDKRVVWGSVCGVHTSCAHVTHVLCVYLSTEQGSSVLVFGVAPKHF